MARLTVFLEDGEDVFAERNRFVSG